MKYFIFLICKNEEVSTGGIRRRIENCYSIVIEGVSVSTENLSIEKTTNLNIHSMERYIPYFLK